MALFSLYFTCYASHGVLVEDLLILGMQNIVSLHNQINQNNNILRTFLMTVLNHHLIQMGCQHFFEVCNRGFQGKPIWLPAYIWSLEYLSHKYAWYFCIYSVKLHPSPCWQAWTSSCRTTCWWSLWMEMCLWKKSWKAAVSNWNPSVSMQLWPALQMPSNSCFGAMRRGASRGATSTGALAGSSRCRSKLNGHNVISLSYIGISSHLLSRLWAGPSIQSRRNLIDSLPLALLLYWLGRAGKIVPDLIVCQFVNINTPN